MSKEDQARGEAFSRFYWYRVESLVPLMDRASQRSVYKAATSSLGNRDARRFEAALVGPTGPISTAEADRICKRYALLEVRRRFDWPEVFIGLPAKVREILEGVSLGVYELDVTLRRQVEALLREGKRDAEKAGELRVAVEGRAGEIAALMDVGRAMEVVDDDVFDFDEVCNSLDRLLNAAGSPDEIVSDPVRPDANERIGSQGWLVDAARAARAGEIAGLSTEDITYLENMAMSPFADKGLESLEGVWAMKRSFDKMVTDRASVDRYHDRLIAQMTSELSGLEVQKTRTFSRILGVYLFAYRQDLFTQGVFGEAYERLAGAIQGLVSAGMIPPTFLAELSQTEDEETGRLQRALLGTEPVLGDR